MNINLSDVVRDQRKFFKSGKTLELSFRLNSLKQLKKVVKDREDALLDAFKSELGKSPFEGYVTEIYQFKKELNFHIKNLPRWVKPEKAKTPLIHVFSKSFIYSMPYGVVLLISPWNYPFNLSFIPLIGAISAGNCVVLKPSGSVPETSRIMKMIAEEAFKPEHVCFLEPSEEVKKNILDEKFDYIFFTGGKEAGKRVMEKAVEHFTPVTLELGGKSPCIVDNEADITSASRRIVWGKFINAGQTCIAPDYILVDRAVKGELIEGLKKSIVTFFGELPENSPDYGRIVDERHFDRLCSFLENGKIIYGGRVNREELFIEPTLIEDVRPEDKIMKEEIFGPILPISEYDSIEEAISFINSLPAPLSLYFFSRNKEKQETVLKLTSSGGGCMNDTLIHFDNINLPFGGVGESGMGRYHGKATFDTFSYRRSVIKRYGRWEVNLRYPPYRDRFSLVKKIL
ncbi:MAG: aldehyde dehydrogenase family protein [Spirochaetes bacterium]|nr:MAG: aldehyde dehydrogenase family protein [Spirochaetota bacterium]